MTTAPVDPRLLRKAQDEVRDALHDLCDQMVRSVLRDKVDPDTGEIVGIDGTTKHVGRSLLGQLREAVTKGTKRGGGGKGSPIPVAVEAFDLLTEIDRRVYCRHSTCPEGGDCCCHALGLKPAGFDIEPNLREVVAACGTSLDLEAILGVRGFLRAWVASIRTMFDPPQRWALHGFHCPECGEKTAYRLDDSDGEEKRTAALEVAFVGTDQDRRIDVVRCLACDEEWLPSQLLFLGRLLGCEIPGVDSEGAA